MNENRCRFLWPVLALTLVGLAACAPFESLRRKPKGAPSPSTLPAPKPELPLAQAGHRFIVADGDDVVGQVQVTVARHEDTLPDLARRFNIGYEEIVRANPGVDTWLPKEGTEIALPMAYVLPDAPREGVVINVAAMRLFYYPKREKGAPLEVITHPVGIGKMGWATPEGSTKVVSRVKDPVWTPPVSVRREHAKEGDILPARVPAGPDNPLGRHMMRLGWTSYLIHGTNKPYGVGMRASHGCVRLYPEDISGLFEQIPVGTKVTVVNQPVLVGRRGNVILAQTYRPLEDDERDWTDVEKTFRKKMAKLKSARWKQIETAGAKLDWPLIQKAAQLPRGVAVVALQGSAQSPEVVVAAAPRVRNALPAGATWDGNEDQYADKPEHSTPPKAATPVARGG